IMAATLQINPVWLWGPFDAAQAFAGSQPPWYFGFLDGGLRLTPPWDLDLMGHELNLSVLIPAMVVPGLMLTALAAHPAIAELAAAARPAPLRPARTGDRRVPRARAREHLPGSR